LPSGLANHFRDTSADEVTGLASVEIGVFGANVLDCCRLIGISDHHRAFAGDNLLLVLAD